MLNTRTREAQRVDAFVDAIRSSAHPNRRPVRLDPPTVELPAVVAYASTRPERHDVPLIDRVRWWALALVMLALLGPIVAAVAVLTAPRATVGPTGTLLPSHAAERLVEGPHGVTR
jgi:hypothetical protein